MHPCALPGCFFSFHRFLNENLNQFRCQANISNINIARRPEGMPDHPTTVVCLFEAGASGRASIQLVARPLRRISGTTHEQGNNRIQSHFIHLFRKTLYGNGIKGNFVPALGNSRVLISTPGAIRLWKRQRLARYGVRLLSQYLKCGSRVACSVKLPCSIFPRALPAQAPSKNSGRCSVESPCGARLAAAASRRLQQNRRIIARSCKKFLLQG